MVSAGMLVSCNGSIRCALDVEAQWQAARIIDNDHALFLFLFLVALAGRRDRRVARRRLWQRLAAS